MAALLFFIVVGYGLRPSTAPPLHSLNFVDFISAVLLFQLSLPRRRQAQHWLFLFLFNNGRVWVGLVEPAKHNPQSILHSTPTQTNKVYLAGAPFNLFLFLHFINSMNQRKRSLFLFVWWNWMDEMVDCSRNFTPFMNEWVALSWL